jgi:lipoprotein NlpD
MKSAITLLAITATALTSCSNTDPEYAEYKKQKEAGATGQTPFGGSTDPYGSGAANPYGTPTQGGSDVGTYTPQNPPYQPLPGVAPNPSADPYAPNPRPGGFPTIPGPAASGPVTTHVVGQGDSIWGLSEKYGVSQDAIRQANGISGDRIVLGTTIQIPGN